MCLVGFWEKFLVFWIVDIYSEFIGRALLEDLDQTDPGRLQGRQDTHREIEEQREAIRIGKERIEKDASPELKRILHEDDKILVERCTDRTSP